VPIVLNFHNEVIEKQAHQRNAPIIFTENAVSTNLVGKHQTKNAALAYEIVQYLGVPNDIINQ
jgi:UDP-N-acetylmuramyl pentapeptide synthase